VGIAQGPATIIAMKQAWKTIRFERRALSGVESIPFGTLINIENVVIPSLSLAIASTRGDTYGHENVYSYWSTKYIAFQIFD
jgi:hypothetical protein